MLWFINIYIVKKFNFFCMEFVQVHSRFYTCQQTPVKNDWRVHTSSWFQCIKKLVYIFQSSVVSLIECCQLMVIDNQTLVYMLLFLSKVEDTPLALSSLTYGLNRLYSGLSILSFPNICLVTSPRKSMRGTFVFGLSLT